MSRHKGTFNFAANFEVLAKAPLDARMLVGTYSDLIVPATWQDFESNIWLFTGAIVSVASDPTPELNGIYYLQDVNTYTDPNSWVKVGSDASIGVINVGDGSGNVFAGYDASGNISLRTISGSGAATVTTIGDQIIIGIDASFGGEINTGNNLGGGDASIYDSKVGSTLNFREISGSQNIIVSVSEGSNAIVIDTSVNFSDIYNLLDSKLDVSGGIINGDLTINGSLNTVGNTTIQGDLYVQNSIFADGSIYVRNIETIDVSAAFIHLNTGQTGTPPLWAQSGIVVERGDLDPYAFIFDESSQSFRIGIASADPSNLFNDASTQAVATREDNPIDTAISIWNDTLRRFDTSTSLLFNQDGLYVDGSVKITSLSGADIRYVVANPDGTLDVTTLPAFVKEASLGNTLTWDSSGFLQVDISATGTGKYDTLLDPALSMTVGVGGYPANTTVADLLGDDFITMFDNLLFPTVNPTYVNPNNTFIDNAASLIEVSSLINITFTSSFNKGAINIGSTKQNDRSGDAYNYNYSDPSGNTLLLDTSSALLSNIQTVNGYLVNVGNQVFTNSVSYLEGPQPLTNKGVAIDSPYPTGTTTNKTTTIEGVYPLFATTSTIGVYTQQPLVSMLSGNNIEFNMVAESGGKQSFSIADAWTGAPTNRIISGIQTFNTVSNAWDYEGGNALTSMTYWTITNDTRTIQGQLVSYDNYVYNGTDRASIKVRLVF